MEGELRGAAREPALRRQPRVAPTSRCCRARSATSAAPAAPRRPSAFEPDEPSPAGGARRRRRSPRSPPTPSSRRRRRSRLDDGRVRGGRGRRATAGERPGRRGGRPPDRAQHGAQRHAARGDRAVPPGELRPPGPRGPARRRLRPAPGSSAAGGRDRRPAELGALRERLAELADLHGAAALLSWDQNTYMPPGGADARAEQLAHARAARPRPAGRPRSSARLLDALEPWAAGLDPDSDEARLVRGDPARPREGGARARRAGGRRWRGRVRARLRRLARGARDGRVRPLPRRARPPGRAAPALRRLLPGGRAPLRRPARRLRAGDDHRRGAAAVRRRSPQRSGRWSRRPPTPDAEPNGGVFSGALRRRAPAGRAAATSWRLLGFDDAHWRLDTAPHPFAQSPGHGDVPHHDALPRPTTSRTRSTPRCTSSATASTTPGCRRQLRRTTLHECASLGIHESQSRLWENVVGRGLPVLHLGAAAPQAAVPGDVRRGRRRRRCSAPSTRSSGR